MDTYEIECNWCGHIFEVEEEDVGKPPFEVDCPNCKKPTRWD